MNLKKRWIVLLLVLIGVTAALEYSPRSVVIRSTLPPVSTCPCNDSPYGTSGFLDLLRESGMNVTVVTGLYDLKRLNTTGYDSVLLLVVAADHLGPNYASIAVEELAGHGLPVYVAVFDEYPTDGARVLLSEAAERFCGVKTPLVIAKVFPSNRKATIAFRDGLRLETGYTSYLSLRGTDLPVATSADIAWRNMYGYTVLAWVWPSSGASPKLWTPLAASCRGPGGGVLMVADSSIVINAALDSSPLYGEESLRLIKDLVGQGKVLVVVDQGMYLSQQARVAVSLHPSFLLLRAGKVYAEFERKALNVLGERSVIGALGVLAGSVLMAMSWASSSSASSVGEKKLRLPAASTVRLGGVSCSDIVSSLRRVNARGLIKRIRDPEVREEAYVYYREVVSYCTSGLAGRLFRVLSGGPGRAEVYRMYVLLVGILGVEPVIGFLEGTGRER